MKLKIYKVIFILLIVSIIIIVGLITMKYSKEFENEQLNQQVIEVFSVETEKQNITLNGYNVIGKVRIPKIEIEYPILDIDTYNPEETKEPMKISIVKYWGGAVNEYGNLSIAGHNNYSGTMFGKTKFLQLGDIIELTDLDNQTIQYEIKNIFVTDPNDISILETKDSSIREVTLITCTNGNKNRLIIKAEEIRKGGF